MASEGIECMSKVSGKMQGCFPNITSLTEKIPSDGHELIKWARQDEKACQ